MVNPDPKNKRATPPPPAWFSGHGSVPPDFPPSRPDRRCQPNRPRPRTVRARGHNSQPACWLEPPSSGCLPLDSGLPLAPPLLYPAPNRSHQHPGGAGYRKHPPRPPPIPATPPSNYHQHSINPPTQRTPHTANTTLGAHPSHRRLPRHSRATGRSACLLHRWIPPPPRDLGSRRTPPPTSSTPPPKFQVQLGPPCRHPLARPLPPSQSLSTTGPIPQITRFTQQ